MTNFAQLKREWAEKYRVPLVHDIKPREYYVASILLFPPSHYLADVLTTLVPDESDVALLGKYIQFRNESWLRPSYIEEMRKNGPVDIDPGVNTVVFAKTQERGWVYGRSSWIYSNLVPEHSSEKRFNTLMEILDEEQTGGLGTPNRRWIEFKERHGL